MHSAKPRNKMWPPFPNLNIDAMSAINKYDVFTAFLPIK
jgi:hypothetical protein